MIKIELGSTDELALRHMGNALTAMAREIKNATSEVSRLRDTVESETDEPAIEIEEITQAEIDTGTLQDDKLDSNGLPWDGRIHSSSKAKTKDGSWKKRKGVDAETLATVEAELRALMAIPVVEAKQDETMEYTEFDEEKFEQATEIVNATPPTPEPIAPKPQDVTPPPPPPVDDVVAGITQDDVEVVSFTEITRFITGTMVKEMGYTIPEVNKLLGDEYKVTFATLKAREELYSTVFNFLKGQPKK